MEKFVLTAPFAPAGDQPKAIKSLIQGLKNDEKNQTLLGVTGSGKTFTMANVIQSVQRPTLIIAHNKTLAAQLANELKEFFPKNEVHYFVSYYDYYQPEAYIPSTATYIEKEVEINEEIDRLRHAATQALLTRHDTIVVASVSCIYGLGSPDQYRSMSTEYFVGQIFKRQELLHRLVAMQYTRNDVDFSRGNFSVKGEIIEIFPMFTIDKYYRIVLDENTIESIDEIDYLNHTILNSLDRVTIFPATHYSAPEKNRSAIIAKIRKDMEHEVKILEKNKKLLEAERLRQRTQYDLEMIDLTGFCKGIENHSRYFDGRKAGEPPFTLLDFFSSCNPNFLTIIDESHMTIPQIGAMYSGDRARKDTLIDYGFRLSAARDNRPLRFEEFKSRVGQTIFVSATPGKYEHEHSSKIVEQIIRPTGLLDPKIEILPTKGQIDNILHEINKRIKRGQRSIIITITKRMAEDLTEYLKEAHIKVQYIHSDIETLDRIDIIRDLRNGTYDVLVGINLLREGLDMPEVSLVMILDADKEGFLRSETAFIQIIGRAARHEEGMVLMYADLVTGSMERAIAETERRRALQEKFNTKNNIIPRSITKSITSRVTASITQNKESVKKIDTDGFKLLNKKQKEKYIRILREQMKIAAENLEYEKAIEIRDEINLLENTRK